MLTNSEDPELARAYLLRMTLRSLLFGLCLILFLSDLVLFIQELLWHYGSDRVIVSADSVIFLGPIGVAIGQIFSTRKPTEEVSQHYRRFGRLPKSTWVTPLAIVLVLLLIVFAGELYMGFAGAIYSHTGSPHAR